MKDWLRRVRQHVAEARALRDETGASVAEIALISSGLVVLSLAVMAAIKALVDSQIPLISD